MVYLCRVQYTSSILHQGTCQHVKEYISSLHTSGWVRWSSAYVSGGRRGDLKGEHATPKGAILVPPLWRHMHLNTHRSTYSTGGSICSPGASRWYYGPLWIPPDTLLIMDYHGFRGSSGSLHVQIHTYIHLHTVYSTLHSTYSMPCRETRASQGACMWWCSGESIRVMWCG